MTNIEAPARQTPGTSRPSPSRKRRWTPANIGLLVSGVVMIIAGLGMFAGAGVLNAVDNHWRDGKYLTSDTTQLSTTGHALAVEEIDLDGLSGDWLGRARVRATGSDPDADLFVGVAHTEDVAAYLSGVQYSTVDEIDDPETRYVEHVGGAPSTEPAASDIWVAQASGSGTQSLNWLPRSGNWTVVVMNNDGSSSVDVTADVGATVPLLERVTWGLMIIGVVVALTGAGLIVLLVRRIRRATRRQS
jgi:hypothetical protein